MSKSNRTEIDALVATNIKPTVATVKHREVLNLVSESAQLKKDVIGATQVISGTAGSTQAVTADFSDKDLVVIDAATNDVNVTITVSNLADGQMAAVKILKNTTRTIEFSGTLDITLNKANINDNETTVVYEIRRKGGANYADCISFNNGNVGAEWVGFTAMTIKDFPYGNDVTAPDIDGVYRKFGKTYMCAIRAIFTTPDPGAGNDYDTLRFYFDSNQGSPLFAAPDNAFFYNAPVLLFKNGDQAALPAIIGGGSSTGINYLTLKKLDTVFSEGAIHTVAFNICFPIL